MFARQLICAFSLFIFDYVYAENDLDVNLPDGTIRGYQLTLPSENKSLNVWQGIPYASPPLGKLRFQAPIPPVPWSGIKETIKTGKSCLTLTHYNLDPDLGEQSEDCLYLNVYAPKKNASEKLPVMLWIYGGGYVSGCSNYDFFGPDALVSENVIVVDFNYRLGSLGFLSTGDEVVLGNAGLKDQLLAFQWTKKNIHLFGGDPEKITIFGESAGGISVGAHLWNKKSAGLFRAAICQSGCSLTEVLSVTNPKSEAYALAKHIDPTVSEQNLTQEVLDLLQGVTAKDLLKAAQESLFQAGIVIEADNENAFVTKKDALRTVSLFENGEFNRVPLIIGTNANEGLTFSQPLSNMYNTEKQYDRDLTSLVPAGLRPKPDVNLTQVGGLIKETYVGPNGLFSKNHARFLELKSDQMFGRSTLKQVQLQSKFVPTYLYQFSFFGTVSELRNYSIPEGTIVSRVTHADELGYLFKVSTFNLKTKGDFITRQRMVKMWTNFAKTLNPTPNTSDDILNVTWTSATPDKIQYLDINEELKMKPNRKKKEFVMWNYVYDTYGTPPFRSF